MIFKSKYFSEPLSVHLRALVGAAKTANKKTQTEREVSLIQYSLENDFREGFRERDHGLDAHTIGRQSLEFRAHRIESERLKQEADFLRAIVKASSELQRLAHMRLKEIGSSVGTSVFEQRQMELDGAWLNIEEKAQ